MRTWMFLLAAIPLASCWVSRGAFLERWDEDGDGWPLGQDCAPSNPSIHPYAADWRGDDCDADCGMEPDQDGDDWPDVADCAPTNPEVYPCSPIEPSDSSIDSDCDGIPGKTREPSDCDPSRQDPAYDETPVIDGGDCNLIPLDDTGSSDP